jgi:uncharacterized membrane protein (UPF0127 family)
MAVTKHQRKRSNNKKPNNNALLISVTVIIAIVFILFFVLFGTYNPLRKKPVPKQHSAASNTSPAFRKDGTLYLIPLSNSSPIKIAIEIADDEAERMRGLMDRFTLPDSAGMFFIFPDESLRSFWMKNTYISLDIIYINANKEIVSIQKYTQPQTTTSIPSERPAKYVLEVNAGFTDKIGINPGDKIDF